MELNEIIKVFPRVRVQAPVRAGVSQDGTITVIKPSGVAVRFDGMGYDVWFWAETQDDRRSRYMSQLEIIK